jgi:DNA-binding transcriptional regulator YiaG
VESQEFKQLLIKANLTKKEFALIIGINIGSMNNWGSTQNIPYWVKSWLENYIAKKKFEGVMDVVAEYTSSK